MEKRTLLPNQLKEVRASIREAGLDDSDFRMEERDTKVSRDHLVSVLIHRPSGFYFYFDHSGGFVEKWWVVCSPGKNGVVDMDIPETWEKELDYFKIWLGKVKEQAADIDPWATSASETETGASALEGTPSQESSSNPETKMVFIGHGRSKVWKDLKDFIQDRLHLQWDEFNRQSQAGKSVKERLEEMLDQACFAFLILTAEDEHADQTIHARENVIHEVGLFQGRLSFAKAIVLLEEGCEQFSNIHGLTWISFPKGNIMAASEEIRRVLEREGVFRPKDAT